MQDICIVIPVCNEQDNIGIILEELKKTCFCMPYHVTYLFVDDGSTDDTLFRIKQAHEHNKNVSFLSLSHNFGKETAIYVGLKHSDSDFVVLMDGDLEHPPSLIPEMMRILEEGKYHAVNAKRKSGFFSFAFTLVFNLLTPVHLQYGVTDYICMTQAFNQEVLKMKPLHRFTKGLFAACSLPMTWIDYKQEKRRSGVSKWGFRSLFKYAIQAITTFHRFPKCAQCKEVQYSIKEDG